MSYPSRKVVGIAVVSMLVVSTCFAKTIEAIGRDCYEGRTKDCAELRKIATTARSPKDRVAAIRFISDRSVLSAIANDATQEQDVISAVGARLAVLDKREAERQRIATQKYVQYPNGFVLPEGAKVDISNPTEVLNFWVAHPGEVHHQSAGGVLPVTGTEGFSGSVLVAGAKYQVGGLAVMLPDVQHGTTLEYAFVSPNCVIRYSASGRGVLALIVGTTEWLLPDFDLEAAIQKGYVYRGRLIQNTEH
ncbi:MAG: hypothetical protein ABSF85_05650 [Terriglobales bacterium]|jgi:hypothetical protein